MRWRTGLALAGMLCFGAEDEWGNKDDVRQTPCTFTEASTSCSVEFDLPGFRRLIQGKPAWSRWDYSIILEPPRGFRGVLEWRVFSFDSKSKKWILEGVFVRTLDEVQQTSVAALTNLRLRTTIKVAAGTPPVEQTPIVVTATPRSRSDFVPLE